MGGQEDNLLFQNLIDNIQDGVLISDENGTILLINKSGEKILGYSADRLCGKKISTFLEEGSGLEEFLQCILDSVFEKTVSTEIVPYPVGDKKKDLRVCSSPLYKSDGSIEILLMFSDLTSVFELQRKRAELTNSLKAFFENFIDVMIAAIEERTPYNAHHTDSMRKYAQNYFKYLKKQGFSEYESEEEFFLMAVRLHDIGKLVIPRSVMDKATRLGEHEKTVLHRIEIAILCEKLAAAQGEKNPEEAEAAILQLTEAGELIEKVNNSGFLDDETRVKVEALKDIKCLTPDGERIPLLDEYETDSLLIKRGTLTEEERKIIESHVVQSGNLLEKMHLTGPYTDITKWVRGHHELIDGSGYPDHLKGDEIPWETRLLTILDIYDSLTADDRPYKRAMSPDRAFEILRSMAKEGKLDSEILEDFYQSNAWKKPESNNGENKGKLDLSTILKNTKNFDSLT